MMKIQFVVMQHFKLKMKPNIYLAFLILQCTWHGQEQYVVV